VSEGFVRRGVLLGLALAAGAPAAWAAAPDPAAQVVDAFDADLIDTMKQARSLGLMGRFHHLEPIVTRAYDIPTMIRIAVGPSWSTMTPAQQSALTEAFRRLTAASYAHTFDGYAGERIEVEPNVVTRGPDKVVQTKLFPAHGAPVAIAYRLRESGGAWKIIDVFYNGAISQLTTRRADFSAILAQGGAPALLAHLNALVDKQLK
jgi:phospholipid transport system substrate-binding protein